MAKNNCNKLIPGNLNRCGKPLGRNGHYCTACYRKALRDQNPAGVDERG